MTTMLVTRILGRITIKTAETTTMLLRIIGFKAQDEMEKTELQ